MAGSMDGSPPVPAGGHGVVLGVEAVLDAFNDDLLVVADDLQTQCEVRQLFEADALAADVRQTRDVAPI